MNNKSEIDNIIDLNIAVKEKNLDDIKILVPIVNSQLDVLEKNFELSSKEEVGGYFGLTDLLLNIADIEITEYIVENFKGLSKEFGDKIKWTTKINKAIFDFDSKNRNAILDEFFASDLPVEKYQYNGIIRLINITQRYELFEKLKEKGTKK